MKLPMRRALNDSMDAAKVCRLQAHVNINALTQRSAQAVLDESGVVRLVRLLCPHHIVLCVVMLFGLLTLTLGHRWSLTLKPSPEVMRHERWLSIAVAALCRALGLRCVLIM